MLNTRSKSLARLQTNGFCTSVLGNLRIRIFEYTTTSEIALFNAGK
jgi:hypothetical protein